MAKGRDISIPASGYRLQPIVFLTHKKRRREVRNCGSSRPGRGTRSKRSAADRLSESGVTREYLIGPGAGMGRGVDPAYLDWFLRYGQAGGSPTALGALERMNSQIDVRDVLPAIQAPRLLMNRTGDLVAHVEAARDMAARILGARFIEWPGDTHGLMDLVDQLVPTFEEFVTGTRSASTSDRGPATVLFVDIVDSTGQVVTLGDSRWRDLLAKADELSRKAVATFRGRWVKNTGDGFLAVFDGPTRAIQCAQATRDIFRSLGFQIRAGLHTGEAEVIGEDVGGLAVHLTARIMSAAGPAEILVSSTVRDFVAGAGVEFREHGPTTLKGFEEPRMLFAVE